MLYTGSVPDSYRFIRNQTVRTLANANATWQYIRHSIQEITTESAKCDDGLNLSRKMNANASMAITRSRVAFQVTS